MDPRLRGITKYKTSIAKDKKNTLLYCIKNRDKMNAIYNTPTDTLTIVFKSAPVAESDEDKPNVILDYGMDGELVSMEILDASATSAK